MPTTLNIPGVLRGPEIRTLLLVTLLLTAPLMGQTAFPGLQGWYQVQDLALAGAGSVLPELQHENSNPAARQGPGRLARAGVLYFPADIRALYLGLDRPIRNGRMTLGLRHRDYGSFPGFDAEARSTGTYSSGDTWLTAGLARPAGGRRFGYGVSAGLFISRLERYTATVAALTPGIVLELPEFQGRLGLSVQNLGLVLDHYTGRREEVPARVVLGFAKQLAHLPLHLGLDAGAGLGDGAAWVRLGGIFRLPLGIQVLWGTSSDKFSQQPHTLLTRDFLAATGIGLRLNGSRYQLEAAGYFYGPGAWASGFGLSAAY